MSWLDDLPKCPKSGKFCHPTEASAARQITSLEAAGKPVADHEAPYRCGSCSCWHIGHDARKLAKSIRRALSDGRKATAAQRKPRRR